MTDDVKIRDAATEDAGAIAGLMTQLGYPNDAAAVRDRLARLDGGDRVFVAVLDGVVAGVAGFHRIPLLHAEGALGRITALVVQGRHRRKGVGRALVARVEAHGAENGCARMEVTSGERRAGAHRFYGSCGYAPDERRFVKHLA